MDPKKWVCGVCLAFFIFAGFWFSDNLFFKESHEASQSLMGELKSTIQGMVTEGWPIISSKNVSLSEQSETPGSVVVLSPNLATCHRSLTDADNPIYCCPPKRESEEPIIDFQFPDPSSPIRVRRPVYRVDEDYIAKYKKALSIMKSFPYDDPRSFMRQADMHCIYCTGAYNQDHYNILLKIHRSWLFFPWHRMMIYFHERIIGSLMGDDTFALPFWNWDSPVGMVIPNMYYNGTFVDSNRDSSHIIKNKTVDINYQFVESGLESEEQISTNLAFMYNQMVSGAKKTELFMGCSYKAGENGFCDGPGTIEAAPHNTVHSWVGSNLNPERENMGAFYSAARDPIFYAHHSNIDRLWEVWKDLRGNEPEIVEPEWLDSYFFFHNEKLQLVRIKIRDVLNITKLGYSYESVDNPWLNARPKPSVSPKIARNILKARDNQNGLQLSSHGSSPDFGPEGRTLDTTIVVKVYRLKTHRTKEEKEEEEEVLVVYGIDVKKDIEVKFDVYVNAIDASSIGPESREFAGTFVNMRRGVRLVKNEGDVEVKRKTDLKLGISELLEDLEADEDESIWVTLVPRGGGANTIVDGVRIEYMR